MRIIDYYPKSLNKIAADRGAISPAMHAFLGWASGGFISLVDRTGTLPLPYDIYNLSPLPQYDHLNKSFAQICDERAQSLLANHEHLHVYWSGGIDSTCALSALLKNGSPDRLTVIMTKASRLEYIKFFEAYIENQVETVFTQPSVFKSVNENVPFVTGELGDQLFGSTKVTQCFGKREHCVGPFEEAFTLGWKEFLATQPELQKNLFEIVEFLKPFVAACPLEVFTAFDFLWWLNIATKWQHVKLRMGYFCSDFNAYYRNANHFFDTPEFQLWSFQEVNHYENKFYEQRTDRAKWMEKGYIYEFTQDENYLWNKKKVGSLPTAVLPPYCFRLESGELIRFGEKSDDAKALADRYGDRFDSIFLENNKNAVYKE